MIAPAEILALANPILGTAVNVLIMCLIPRLFPATGYFRSVMAAFGAGLAALLVLEGVRYGVDSGDTFEFSVLLASNLAVYACLGFLFFNAVNVGEASIRVRILRELMAADGAIAEAELLSRYNDRTILSNRLARLLENGQIRRQDGRYFLEPGKLLLIAKLIRVVKYLLFRRTSEFD